MHWLHETRNYRLATHFPRESTLLQQGDMGWELVYRSSRP
ncbi:hypothetical protein FMEAI12_3280023 [Parafrankia sp. Ea1.12]|nr:hypothetical protein FMEAI12_3280023 [Parafrankia sp. Ea1.12]